MTLPFATTVPTTATAAAAASTPVTSVPSSRSRAGDEIVISDGTVWAGTPEGAVATMPLGPWMDRLRPSASPHTGMVLPDGVRAVVSHSSGRGMVWVTEIPPRVWSVDWVAPDSPADFGPGTKYVRRSLAFPYLILLTPFAWDGCEGGEGLCLDRGRVELFWRNAPLESLDDALHYPALLNVTKFLRPADPGYEPRFASKPLSWLCTQYLVQTPDLRARSLATRLRAGYRQLLVLLAGQSFNRSSENHPGEGEQMSWYTWSVQQGVEPRIADTVVWEEATRKDPLWVLEANWLPVELNLSQVIERMFSTTLRLPPVMSGARVEDLTRIVFQHQHQGNLS